MAKSSRQRAGGQLNRTETVTVRLDPKLNYLCELAARSQRRTKSSLIEAALVDALNNIPVDPRPSPEQRQSIAASAENLWDVKESDRFIRLAAFAQHLMTFDEQKIWSVLLGNALFWSGEWEMLVGSDNAVFMPNYSPGNVLRDRVAEYWEDIKAVAHGEKEPTALPQTLTVLPWSDNMLHITMTVPVEPAGHEAGEING